MTFFAGKTELASILKTAGLQPISQLTENVSATVFAFKLSSVFCFFVLLSLVLVL